MLTYQDTYILNDSVETYLVPYLCNTKTKIKEISVKHFLNI
jgi:hypothetical protein